MLCKIHGCEMKLLFTSSYCEQCDPPKSRDSLEYVPLTPVYDMRPTLFSEEKDAYHLTSDLNLHPTSKEIFAAIDRDPFADPILDERYRDISGDKKFRSPSFNDTHQGNDGFSGSCQLSVDGSAPITITLPTPIPGKLTYVENLSTKHIVAMREQFQKSVASTDKSWRTPIFVEPPKSPTFSDVKITTEGNLMKFSFDIDLTTKLNAKMLTDALIANLKETYAQTMKLAENAKLAEKAMLEANERRMLEDKFPRTWELFVQGKMK